jgi:hypothetical protein
MFIFKSRRSDGVKSWEFLELCLILTNHVKNPFRRENE